MEIVGFRFSPTPVEIIFDYLFNKVTGRPLPSNSAIIDCDIYDGSEEWMRIMLEQSGGDHRQKTTLYFFTRLKKKTEKGRRTERVTGSGTWKETQKTTPIQVLYGGNEVQVGSRRGFKFFPKKGCKIEGRKWLMDEFQLDGCLGNVPCADDFRVCRIKLS